MVFMVNDYILITIYLSPFSTYKYHLGAWGKRQQQRQQTLESSLKVFFFSILSLR